MSSVNPRYFWVISLLIIVCLINFSAQAKYGGGTGEPNDPYLIYTANQFNTIGTEPNDWDKHFKLMEDINLAGIAINPIGYWTQIDDKDDIPFSGVFDGNGNSIINFNCNYSGNVGGSNPVSTGLFKCVSGLNAEIENLTIIDPNIDGGAWTGSLVGYMAEGTVRNCHVIGGNVCGKSKVGGLIGRAEYSIINNCYSSTDVNGSSYIGGLVGFCYNDTIIMNCGTTGTVNGTEYDIGGLIGCCGGGNRAGNCITAGSFSSGDVSGNSSIGGLAGMLSYSQIACSYATGQVSGDDYVGGLVGNLNAPRIIDSYSAGLVNGTGENVGGLTGDDWPPAYDCFWDTEASGMSTSGLGTGLTTLDMQDPNTFLDAGWDFVGESENGPSDIWVNPEGGGYPILSWQASSMPALPNFSGGTGEPNNPYIITTAAELNSIGHNPRLMDAHFELANDINLAGIEFFPIGHEGYPFSGVFDGNDCQISNFSYEASKKYRKNIGLFKYVRGLDSEIRNLMLINSNVINQIKSSAWDSSRAENTGSLVGFNYEGTIFNCHVDEDSEVVEETSAGYNTGGLIGQNRYGTIKGCSSAATVNCENEDMGGLLGYNYLGLVIDCHSSGDVYGDFTAGGLVGSNHGYLEFCTSSAQVSGSSHVGGLTGENWSLILGCIASGDVSGSHDEIGGLVGGWNVGWIYESCSYGDVTGDESVGGLVGENIGIIANSYSRCSVTGSKNVGGLVGNNTYYPNVSGEIETSYSTGFVSGDENVGGLTYRGSDSATTSDDCFWNVETSGQTESDGGVGKTTIEMQNESTFTVAGWDYIGETINGPNDIWWIDEGNDYPRLWWEQINIE